MTRHKTMNPYTKVIAISLLVVAAGLLTVVGSARADPYDALRNDPRVHNGLLALTVGSHIEETCPTIDRRGVAATTFMLGLANHALSLGYTSAEVRAYVREETERARYIALARRYFAERGVSSDDDVAGACRVGRDEIATGSAIGRLLREG